MRHTCYYKEFTLGLVQFHFFVRYEHVSIVTKVQCLMIWIRHCKQVTETHRVIVGQISMFEMNQTDAQTLIQ